MDGQEWSKSVLECLKRSTFSKIIEDAHLDGLSGVEQGSSSVENFHGLKPLHLPLMFQKRRGKVWARIFKASGKGVFQTHIQIHYHYSCCFRDHHLLNTKTLSFMIVIIIEL